MVDSTRVKVYVEGEWKVRQHGVGKHRTWRKLHLCMDEATLESVSVVASTNDVSDAEALPACFRTRQERSNKSAPTAPTRERRCYDAPESPSGEGSHPAPQRGQDLEPRQQQGGAPRPRREPAADPKSRAQTVEAGEQLSSPEPGVDTGLPLQDDLRRPVANAAD